MTRDLSPTGVAQRLEALRQLHVPVPVGDGRAVDEPGAQAREGSFDEAVARRLDELRALLELTAYLHRARRA